jgi:hypothetical protein
MLTIPTEDSQYTTPDRVDSFTEYSSVIRWPSSTEYATVPLAPSLAQPSSLPPLICGVSKLSVGFGGGVQSYWSTRWCSFANVHLFLRVTPFTVGLLGGLTVAL